MCININGSDAYNTEYYPSRKVYFLRVNCFFLFTDAQMTYIISRMDNLVVKKVRKIRKSLPIFR